MCLHIGRVSRGVQTNDTPANRYAGADWPPDVTECETESSPSFLLVHAHHRVDILIKCTNGNGLRYIHFAGIYIYIYIRILDRIPKYSIGRQSDEEAFVWTLDSLDWVFRDIIIYVDDSRLVWSLRNCCRYFLNIVPRILWLFVIRSSKVKNSLLILYVLLIYDKKIRFIDKKKKYVQQIEIYMYIFVKK